MGIYRKYDNNFNTEIAKVEEISKNVTAEIGNIESNLNTITETIKDRTSDDYLVNLSESINSIKKKESDAVIAINELLGNINNLLAKYEPRN